MVIAFFISQPVDANGCLSAYSDCQAIDEGSYDSWESAYMLTTNFWEDEYGEEFPETLTEPETEFEICQAAWAQWSRDCEAAINERAANVKDVCTIVTSLGGLAQNKVVQAIGIGCFAGAKYEESNAEETCAKEALKGILENCLA